MKSIFYVLVLMMISGMVIAQSSGSASSSGVVGTIASSISMSTITSWLNTTTLLKNIAMGSLTVAAIIILQYAGFDVIGNTFSILFWFIDFMFTILRACLASEANLIAFVILFILLWLSLMSF